MKEGCKHRFCRVCVGALVDKASVITCPLRRKVTSCGYRLCLDQDGEKSEFALPGSANLWDLAAAVEKMENLGDLKDHKTFRRILVQSDSAVLVELDDCRLHPSSDSEGITACPYCHHDMCRKLICLLPFNVVSATHSQQTSIVPITITASLPSAEEKCRFTLKIGAQKKSSDDLSSNKQIVMFRHRTVSDLYEQVYRCVFGSTSVRDREVAPDVKMTVGIVYKGNIYDPASPQSISAMVQQDESEVTIHLVLARYETLKAKFEPIFQTCTGGLMELLFLHGQGVVKEPIYKEKIKHNDLCAHCLENLCDKKKIRKHNITPAILSCNHLVHVECLVPNVRQDLMKRCCFVCQLCEDTLYSQPCADTLKDVQERTKKQSVPVPDQFCVHFQTVAKQHYYSFDLKRSDSIQVIYDFVRKREISWGSSFQVKSLGRNLDPQKHVFDYPGLHLAVLFVC